MLDLQNFVPIYPVTRISPVTVDTRVNNVKISIDQRASNDSAGWNLSEVSGKVGWNKTVARASGGETAVSSEEMETPNVQRSRRDGPL